MTPNEEQWQRIVEAVEKVEMAQEEFWESTNGHWQGGALHNYDDYVDVLISLVRQIAQKSQP